MIYKFWIMCAALGASALSAQVTYERLLKADAEPQNWLTYSRILPELAL